MSESKPIERDEAHDRTYIPLPGGWEIQTKGKGSTFRIAQIRGHDDYTRWPVQDEHLHIPLHIMAVSVHEAMAAQAAELTRLREVNKGLTEALTNARSWVRFYKDESATACLAQIDAALNAAKETGNV